MEIDSHILSLSMEFEKQNIIITEWETEKAKNKSDQISAKRKKKKMRRRQPKIYLEATRDNDYEDEGAEECDDDVNDDNESGFEVRVITLIYRSRKNNVEQPNCITLTNMGQPESFSSFIVSRLWKIFFTVFSGQFANRGGIHGQPGPGRGQR